MRFQIRIKKNGDIVHEVLDREQENCSNIKQFTAAFGRELSDEVTGPECDKVEEITTPS